MNNNIIIDLDDLPCHRDNRGEIQMVLEEIKNVGIRSISRITSLPNSLRARHMHAGFHYCEVIRGSIEYYHGWLDVDSQSFVIKPEKYIVKEGQIVFTPEFYFHQMNFNEHTIFNCYASEPRKQDQYEEGLKRFPNIDMKYIYDNWEGYGE